ncbi:ATP-dependent zinc metalloprotease FtsH [Lawsonella clevelandensis]|uniref:ATP-dependent zinc metalloprotease FtsH n=1 Tax=Lawsonella clevelandensis TaxID=1528099 RepID=UPI0007C59043|nr:ATP-dependent zinc metalloprotease FtsH [Lawsonella clevelandensis]
MDRKKLFRNIGIIAFIVLLFVGLSFFGANNSVDYQSVNTSVALQQIKDGNVQKAVLEDREQVLKLTLKKKVKVEPATPQKQSLFAPPSQPGTLTGDKKTKTVEAQALTTQFPAAAADDIFTLLESSKVDAFTTEVHQSSWFTQALIYLGPTLLLILLMVWFFGRMQKNGPMGFGKSTASGVNKDRPTTTFKDVAGEDEAVEELNEIKDFLQHPDRYEKLGAKIPRGVLLYGPPGTGKTLLARAVAGEAGVPFFPISGSDFVEMFAGVGASRVRDLFEQAKKNNPCIIFIDEIDAVGRQRGAGIGGGHDEREQTLNQLLVEMDGFDDRHGVILIAATNRVDVLDPALLRPGRFDRQIPVTNPDLKGRQAILKVHAKGKPFTKDCDLDALAKRTVGFSGADLANVLNEAALLTARQNQKAITPDNLEEATDRVIGGPRRTGRIISEKEKKVTAYHEAGHTICAWAMPQMDPVYKVTILPRGRTGGYSMVAGEDDSGLRTRTQLLSQIVFAMGGRTAEELVFAEPTTGASNDIEQATKIARAMVSEWGMSAKLGPVKYGEEEGDPFLGRTLGTKSTYSHEVARDIDEEVHRIIDACHTEAWATLSQYRDLLDTLSFALLEKETLRRPELEEILGSIDTRPRITEFDDFGERIPSSQPPVKTPGELAKERGEEWPPKMEKTTLPEISEDDIVHYPSPDKPAQPGRPKPVFRPIPHGPRSSGADGKRGDGAGNNQPGGSGGPTSGTGQSNGTGNGQGDGNSGRDGLGGLFGGWRPGQRRH